MERVETLINRLKEQFEQKLAPEKLLVTAQMLLAELQQHTTVTSQGKISVVMPQALASTAITMVDDAPEQTTTIPVKEPVKPNWLFNDPITAIPTLAHQNNKEVFELNDVMMEEQESLNEKLKEEKAEIAATLQSTPVKDLKKAVGINDKYLIINELFRGDENMYERSIKTINGFEIYPEAEFWIKRELKTKLGWSEDNETVQLFDVIVKRRFS